MLREKTDEFFMYRALRLAKRGKGRVSPNPMVGAVIVKTGEIIGEGYHQQYGGPHAEINAISNSPESLKGSSFYITLEPCTHYGKTPPCIESILKIKPAEVIIGTPDPNPLVSGRGIQILKENGIHTKVGILENECRILNEKFFKFIQHAIPFVTLKFAQSLDGRIAAVSGDSKWISSEPSRKLAHRERSLHDAVLVGAGTVIADDPDLTVRLVRGKNPIRIILDSKLKIPLSARILKNQNTAKTIIISTAASRNQSKLSDLQKMGIEILEIDSTQGGQIDLAKLLPELAKKGLSSILVEGGSEIITSFLKTKIADRLLVFTAPKLIGKGIEAIGDLGINRIEEAIRLEFRKVFQKEGDLVIDARILK